jgi:outer membrane protein OmpA-like peptidoglycan-associated protein
VNDNGVLFFASNGHPGYGGFDIYRTTKVNGEWTKPVNLGQPINSPGDDIFFALQSQSSRGYFASARPGGKGDLDIYKVHYVITDLQDCRPAQDILAINAMQEPTNPMAYNISLAVPEDQKANIRSYMWSVNGKPLAETKASFYHVFDKPETYVVTAKVVAGCDTCPQLMALCSEKTLEVKNEILAATEPKEKIEKGGRNPNKKEVRKGRKQEQPGGEDLASENTSADNENKKAGTRTKSAKSHVLNDEELKSMNWSSQPMTFALNEAAVSEETKAVLDQNVTVLKSNDGLKVVIIGHADCRGSAAYNRSLSLKRAKTVQEYFVQKGVDAKQIKAVKGKGEEELVNNCSDGVECSEEEHAQNRRVQIEVSGTVKEQGSITSN